MFISEGVFFSFLKSYSLVDSLKKLNTNITLKSVHVASFKLCF